MAMSVYSYREAESKTAKPLAVTEAIRTHLRDDECWAAMEPYLMPKGVTGSKFYDQAYALEALLEFDAKNGGAINSMMNATPQFSHRVLWDRVNTQIRKAGFRMKGGRLMGLLEEHEANGDEGEADVD